MRDFATSQNPAVQAQLNRLAALSLPQGRLGLETIRALLARLGDPQKRLPPAFHVAGTNGKGSTCAFLRAILEAEGLRVHAATSPHLVRYNERIRLAGELIDDALLAALLSEVLDAGEDLGPSFFEVTAAATFLAFARVPGDACVIEVGLGGRFDATNVLDDPAACGIASLGIDHEAFLLAPEPGTPEEPIARIAFEKAGIARRGRPLVTQAYPEAAAQAIAASASRGGAALRMRGQAWQAEIGTAIEYGDMGGRLSLPLPTMPGAHQSDNAALAVAMLRHQDRIVVSREAMAKGILAARWPARMQLLGQGPLTDLAPGRRIWLDGGHNPDAGQAIARSLGANDRARPLHLILGMLANKNPAAILEPLAGRLLSVSVVPIPGHDAHPPVAFAPHTELPVRSFPDVAAALRSLASEGDVLIAGSLYLAGAALSANGELPF